MTDDWRNAGFGLYVHWPFCEAKCPYCDFNSHVSREIDHSAWVRAYLVELSRVAQNTPDRILNTVYFGGGTPSLMNPDTVGAILEQARSLWPVANDLEVTLEANPGSVEASRFAGFRDAGVNRVSVGIQALNDPDLRRLGRIHTAAEARTALEIAHSCFDRVSFDLIYGRQDQTLGMWENELKQALTLSSDHISLYQLTVEDGTVFAERFARGGLKGLPTDDLGADMYDATLNACAAKGLEAYEVSNFARSGSESRHNLIYWHYGDYVGIGPGAHGRVSTTDRRYATECVSAPDQWLIAVDRASSEKTRSLEPQEQADEFLMMGLRLSEGIDPGRYLELCGRSLDMGKINELCDMGMLSIQNQRICATKKGRVILNAILRELLTG